MTGKYLTEEQRLRVFEFVTLSRQCTCESTQDGFSTCERCQITAMLLPAAPADPWVCFVCNGPIYLGQAYITSGAQYQHQRCPSTPFGSAFHDVKSPFTSWKIRDGQVYKNGVLVPGVLNAKIGFYGVGDPWTCFVCKGPIRAGDDVITNTKPEGVKYQHAKCPANGAHMNEIVQHFPAYVERMGEPSPRAKFSTLSELEAIPFVARFKAGRADFLRFSKSDNCLMAEYSPTPDEPAGSHWVIGFLRDPAAVDLPEWAETEPQRLRREAWNSGEAV